MSEKICGKVFSTPEEEGRPAPSEDELARARHAFADFRKQRAAVPPEDRVTELSPKFWDDTSGTEFERREPSE
ncbi:hypothetical protein [Mycobacterium stomatepiae]|uniref:Uncharacterized protein n=1 Tax=Mycobacterium stomatepiae TaxID=470076 RepID=A0A7I7Q190_9MYCO|nr:hypothetical protein [Mycobacterium stomatepiae]MCV7166451.1 hypothetical protein [Mycobacterium stomatepiae]BBY20125.1 hypothetical protein MSTO_03300 [Mycobacterium stomatepiae]